MLNKCQLKHQPLLTSAPLSPSPQHSVTILTTKFPHLNYKHAQFEYDTRMCAFFVRVLIVTEYQRKRRGDKTIYHKRLPAIDGIKHGEEGYLNPVRGEDIQYSVRLYPLCCLHD